MAATHARNPSTTHSRSSDSMSELSFSNIYQQAGSLFETSRQYATRHPYQIALGAASIIGAGALAAYWMKRKH